MTRVAVLDDWQGVAQSSTDWSPLKARAAVVFFGQAFDGENGWGISGDTAYDPIIQDTRDAAAFYDLLEHEVAPLFYDRDSGGIPRGWVRRIKRSLATNGPRFSATRMVRDYIDTTYALETTAGE